MACGNPSHTRSAPEVSSHLRRTLASHQASIDISISARAEIRTLTAFLQTLRSLSAFLHLVTLHLLLRTARDKKCAEHDAQCQTRARIIFCATNGHFYAPICCFRASAYSFNTSTGLLFLRAHLPFLLTQLIFFYARRCLSPSEFFAQILIRNFSASTAGTFTHPFRALVHLHTHLTLLGQRKH